MTPVIAIDLSFLSHQARLTMRDLKTADDIPSGVVYGVLNRVLSIGHRFKSNRIVFCCDGYWEQNPRRFLFPAYKEARHTKEETPEEQKVMAAFYKQINCLRSRILPLIGFGNIFWDGKHEADDFFGKAVERSQAPVIMVTNDGDMYQLLKKGMVMMWNPTSKEMTTEESFVAEYPGLMPREWAKVKAIAGCDGDGVPGIAGVGIKTSYKYLMNKLSQKTKAYENITSGHGMAIIQRNYPLVRLPFSSTPPITFQSNQFSVDGLMQVCVDYDIASFVEPEGMARWMSFFHSEWQAAPYQERPFVQGKGRIGKS